MFRMLGIAYCLIMLSGCAHWKFWESSPEKESVVGQESNEVIPGGPAPLKPQDLDLKIAQLNSRLQELENENIRQKEQIHLIRKAVVLGIVPQDLKNQFYEERDAKPMADKPRRVDPPVASEVPAPKSVNPVESSPQSAEKAPKETPKEEIIDEKAYQQKLSQAQALFGGAKYGEAIAAYSAIGRDFPLQLTKGNHYYWIGLSWFYLKEYDFAQKNLQEMIAGYATSPLVPKARYFMAKIEMRKGLKETALQHFRSVITEYPQDEAAEMAKAEIKQLEESL